MASIYSDNEQLLDKERCSEESIGVCSLNDNEDDQWEIHYERMLSHKCSEFAR